MVLQAIKKISAALATSSASRKSDNGSVSEVVPDPTNQDPLYLA